MTVADLVAGDIIFVDANIFVYHFAPDPVLQIPCSQLLQRIENREIQAFTSTHVLAEAAHRRACRSITNHRLTRVCCVPCDGRRLLSKPRATHYRRPVYRAYAGPRRD